MSFENEKFDPVSPSITLCIELFIEEKSVTSAKAIVAFCSSADICMNVYNVAFFIWHDGPFGTINGFRLGRCPSILTDWNEVNMAWGQTALLLATISHKLSFTFSKYRLIPMGSTSRITKSKREQSSYDLHSKNGGGGIFSRSTFNLGMGAFLSCLDEICKYVAELDPAFLLPHPINGENHA